MESHDSLPAYSSRTGLDAAPVVLGGSVDSGMRVVAEILARAGIHLGTVVQHKLAVIGYENTQDQVQSEDWVSTFI